MDELKDEYEDLNNLIDNLKIAVNECNNTEYREQILELMRQIQIDIEDIEPQIFRQEEYENKELISEFERSRLC